MSRFWDLIRLAADHIGETEYCKSFNIDNVGNKSIRLFGEKVELQVEDDLTSEDAGHFAKVEHCQRVYHFSVRINEIVGVCSVL